MKLYVSDQYEFNERDCYFLRVIIEKNVKIMI